VTALPTPSPLAAQWALARDVVYLNHGSFGACPRSVLNDQFELRAKLEANPIRFLVRDYPPLLDAAREEVAQLLGASSEDLVFTQNATVGVNVVVRSLDLHRGDELLTTNHDYNACRCALEEAARRNGARVVVAEIPFPLESDEEIVGAILAALTSRTRLAMIDHITSPTALILPIERIVRELQSRGVDVLVDGAHAAGMVELDLAGLGAAYYTGNLHKWTCAPKGAAYLWVREDRRENIHPLTVSHGENTRRPGRSAFHDRFDWPGTLDPTAWLCAGSAVRWCSSLLPGGWDELMSTNHQLVVNARRLLCESLHVTAPCPASMLGSMATIPLPPALQNGPPSSADLRRFQGWLGADRLQAWLAGEHRIEVPIIRWGKDGRRWLRISTQAYNSRAQFEHLAEVLQTAAAG
jgi:isopenicillin-N epimerase